MRNCFCCVCFFCLLLLRLSSWDANKAIALCARPKLVGSTQTVRDLRTDNAGTAREVGSQRYQTQYRVATAGSVDVGWTEHNGLGEVGAGWLGLMVGWTSVIVSGYR